MAYDRNTLRFPAVLKDQAGKVLEMGSALLSLESRSIDFKSSFVPLFSMGTRLQIIRMHEDTEVHLFMGEVYLSSPQMLRIVSVEEQVLPGACYAFLYHVDLEGVITATLRGQRRHFFRRTRELPSIIPVKLHALSVKGLKFTTDQTLEQGQILTLSTRQEPALSDVALQVIQAVVFGQEINSYRCRILEIDPISKENLIGYMQQRSQRAGMVFGADPEQRAEAWEEESVQLAE
jgi:hypothetical protein